MAVDEVARQRDHSDTDNNLAVLVLGMMSFLQRIKTASSVKAGVDEAGDAQRDEQLVLAMLGCVSLQLRLQRWMRDMDGVETVIQPATPDSGKLPPDVMR